MPSMGYCKWENTAGDLRSCVTEIEDYLCEGSTAEDLDRYLEELSSDDERRGCKRAIRLVHRLAELVPLDALRRS